MCDASVIKTMEEKGMTRRKQKPNEREEIWSQIHGARKNKKWKSSGYLTKLHKRGGVDTVYHQPVSGPVQKSIKASSVSRRDSSSSIPVTSFIKISRFSTILTVGCLVGDEGEGGMAG